MSVGRVYYNAADEARYGREHLEDGSEPLVREFLAASSGGGPVVELGPGKGALAMVHPNYVGIDLSGVALHRYLRPRGARAIQADAECLPLASQSVDCLFSIATLEHVPHPERALAEIDRVLRPGGRALLWPAWFCRPWAAKGLPIVPYRALRWPDRLRKASIPIRDNLMVRLLHVVPRRIVHEIRARLYPGPTPFTYRRLTPNLREYIYTDCDAFTSMDPHTAALYFQSRGYDVAGCERWTGRLRLRHQALVIRKGPAQCG